MKIKNILLTLTLLFQTSLLTAEKNDEPPFQANIKCKKCHPDIYAEYEKSMHRNSTVFTDPIHKAVWDKHPSNIDHKQYTCAKCHTPTADNIADMTGEGTKGIPDATNETHTEGILCAYCHRIESVEHGEISNTNKILKEKDEYYGTRKDPIRSRNHYHTYNENFKNGQVCMGCHSHNKNVQKLDVCVTDMGEVNSKENCITCHMPQVKGDVSTKGDTGTYAFHGFPGANAHKDMLLKYIDMKFTKGEKDFTISIYNQSPHNMMLHPLRSTQLHVSVQRDGEVQKFDPEMFMRVIGKEGKPSSPWVADSVVINTMIKGKENREVKYAKELQKGDIVKVVLGYYLVIPDVVDRLGLGENEKVKEFHILKDETYTIE